MARKFRLINEKGQEYSLIDIQNYCALIEPTGLGYSYNREYEQIDNTYIETFMKIEQNQIEGTLLFLSYDNYRKFTDFIEKSEELKFVYKIPFQSKEEEFFRDIKIKSLTKKEIQSNGILNENIVFDCLSLWYKKTTAIYDMKAQTNEIRWDFKWDSRFVDYDTRKLKYINHGHIEAPILVEINGHVINPKISLYIEGELYQEVPFLIEIAENEKILYGTKENEFYINKQNIDGTLTNLFSLDYLDFYNDNVIRIPQNRSCEIRLTAQNGISKAKVEILTYYKIV